MNILRAPLQPTPTLKQLYKLNQQQSKLLSRMQRLERAKALVNDRRRRQATTTKAQLGGLLIVSGVAEAFGIQLGEDLQSEKINFEKTTPLLEYLMVIYRNVQMGLSILHQRETWLAIGVHLLTSKANQSLARHEVALSRSHTRTVIQLGGLLWKSTLPKACGIAMGDDLQSTYQQLTKAALLLGGLLDKYPSTHSYVSKD